VGRSVDSDSSLVTKKWATDYQATVVVDANYVKYSVAAEIASNALQTTAYADQQDALRAHKTDVTTADANYVDSSRLNAANRVAGLDTSGAVFSAQVPAGLVTSRLARFYGLSQGTAYLSLGSTQSVSTATLREHKIAEIAMPDFGFPWILRRSPWCRGTPLPAPRRPPATWAPATWACSW
jgi:hypothetical protein